MLSGQWEEATPVTRPDQSAADSESFIWSFIEPALNAMPFLPGLGNPVIRQAYGEAILHGVLSVEYLLGDPNTVSPSSYYINPVTRLRGPDVPALSETDQLLSIARNETTRAAAGVVIGPGVRSALVNLQSAGGSFNASPPTVYAGHVAPGPFAHSQGWIPLRGPGRDFWAVEIRANNYNGDRFGCHICGTFITGTKSGNWPLDHQPPVGLQIPGVAYRGLPICASCGLVRQGGTSQPFEVLRIRNR